MTRKILFALICLLTAALASACEFTAGAPTPIGSEAATLQPADYTEAAGTVIANLTPDAQNLTPTPENAQGNAPGTDEGAQPAAFTATGQPPTKAPTQTTAPTNAPQASDTPQPTPTVTPSPTKTPIPTATFSPSDIRSRLGEPSVVENFSDPGPYNWYAYEDERVRFQAKEDGKLYMTAFEPNFELGWALMPLELDSKFYLEVDYTPQICAELDRYGIIISPTKRPNRGYMYDFSCDGKFSFWIWDGVNEKVTSLASWTKSEYIRPGANRTNRIGIMVDINKFYLYANGNLIYQVTNDRFDKIYAGIMVGGKKTDNFTVVTDTLNYWILK
ncbi:MAG: hypothetical protein ACOYYS_12390 [Chloroflexota bacterium]